MRRESYNWLVDAVGLYKARVWEMARLNLTHTMLSKRKLIHLVKESTFSFLSLIVAIFYCTGIFAS